MSSRPNSIGMFEDQGIRHAYIRPASSQLNGKVERSHRTDEQEFYQLLTYTDDVDLRARLSEWEQFCNPPGLTVHSTEKRLTRSSANGYNRRADVS